MIAALAVLWGCGGPAVDCETPASVIAEADGVPLTCARADWLVDWWTVLRAAPIPEADQRLVRKEVRDRFRADPKGTQALLDRARDEGRQLLALRGSEATRTRSRRVHDALRGKGLVTEAHGELGRLQGKLLPVWSTSDAARVALTEADVEAWIRFASLCREVQGGTPLRISVADRVGVYRAVQRRFESGDTDDQLALASLGPTWLQIQRAWILADYDSQQGWIRDAPLPGPMTATSVEYAREIVGGDVAGYVAALQRHFGPFTVAPDQPMFETEDSTAE